MQIRRLLAVVAALAFSVGALETAAQRNDNKNQPKRSKTEQQDVDLSVAMVVVDNATGEVLARVASPDYFDERRAGQVDLTQAVRSPGSTLKPFIYGLGFEDGLVNPETLIEDRPIHYPGYQPENFDLTFKGTVTVRRALQLSLNVPAVTVLDAAGPNRLAARLGGAGASLILQAVAITLTIFIGLTITVFVTKKDFSFLRGALTIGAFAMLGIIIASAIFGFHLGALFCGFGVLLLSGYILYQTSLVMSYFPPSGYVAAALMLFSTIATLFWYVLQLLMSLRSD